MLGLKCTIPIKKGEPIFTRYTTPQTGTIRRQQNLQNTWYFSCDCQRCLDPTECGSMTNALKCSHCLDKRQDTGFMLPDNPRNINSPWTCQTRNCHSTLQANEAIAIIMEIEDLLKLEEQNVRKLALLLKKFPLILHISCLTGPFQARCDGKDITRLCG